MVSYIQIKIFLMINCLLVLGNSYDLSQNPNIVGEWKFEKFAYPNDEFSREKFIIDANQSNKGLTITFTADGKFISKQPRGLEINNTSTWYKVINEGKQIIISGDTSKILLLSFESLQVFHDNDRPILFLKRSGP